MLLDRAFLTDAELAALVDDLLDVSGDSYTDDEREAFTAFVRDCVEEDTW